LLPIRANRAAFFQKALAFAAKKTQQSLFANQTNFSSQTPDIHVDNNLDLGYTNLNPNRRYLQ
jgi:hypothetical protein